jgi:uncharacterized protein YecT (DUF1311 family)
MNEKFDRRFWARETREMAKPNWMTAVVAAILALAPAPGEAAGEFERARSSEPTLIRLCDSSAVHELDGCKNGFLNDLSKQADAALLDALAKAHPSTVPLLRRDQAWFRDSLTSAAERTELPPEVLGLKFFETSLGLRKSILEEVASALGRSGVTGRWVNAFGTVEVEWVKDDLYRARIETSVVYGPGSDQSVECEATAQLRRVDGNWLTGTPSTATPNAAAASDEVRTAKKSTQDGALQPMLIKMRRQGETLRIVVEPENADEDFSESIGCNGIDQITGTYFAAGPAGSEPPAGAEVSSSLAPAFDCARPVTATAEEICADPELAENDVRLNKAWARLLPRLDDVSRRALVLDQRGYVGSQSSQFPQFLNPAWKKQRGHMNFTGDARDKLRRLQRERIAVLEGFDEKRRGVLGLWMAYNAIIRVARDENGDVTAKGWKWEQGDWKASCPYEMEGKIAGDVFKSNGKRTNPDTLERDHASLIVNRLDDAFAKRRTGADGPDEPKCRRNVAISSTVRMFPVRPSPDIDTIGSIR